MVLAKIFDIDDEDIQKEYMSSFNKVVYLYDELKEDYEKQGFNENSEKLLQIIQMLLLYLIQNMKFEVLISLKGFTGISIIFPFFKLDFFSCRFFMQDNTFSPFYRYFLFGNQ